MPSLLSSSSLSIGANNANNVPVMDPHSVRALTGMASSQGARLAILGSGCKALELAAYCARLLLTGGRHRGAGIDVNVDDASDNRGSGGGGGVVLLFGQSGPMSRTLPRYVSSAVTRRLRQHGVEVEERSLTRYVAMDRPMSSSHGASDSNDSPARRRMPPRLELYTVKSYDNLDGRRILADLMVLAPSVDGMQGTAVVPTPGPNDDDDASSSSSSSTTTTNHLPWSFLVSPPLIACYLDDGRISTNVEFEAASSIFAAGSVARYPNPRTGKAEVAGGRHVSSELVGEVAATNMVVGYGGIGNVAPVVAPRYFPRSIPVWRSDVVPYAANDDDDDKNNNNDEKSGNRPNGRGMRQNSSTLALYSMGIHALCVGRCDSEGMATHGFWWTNQSMDSKTMVDGIAGKSNGKSNESIGPNAFMRRATRAMTSRRTTSSLSNGSRGSLPVYGSGVIFYVDRSGQIEGVMLWGLPFSMNPNDVQSTLNKSLVDRMKKIISSNGGIAIQDHSDDIIHKHSGLNMDVSLLSYLHLAEESKFLASMALLGSSSRPAIAKESLLPEEVLVKRHVGLRSPLHRYTPIKSIGVMNLGKVRRTDETGLLAEDNDLFYSSMAPLKVDATCQRVEEFARPPSLKRVDPMQILMNLADQEDVELQMDAERRKMQMERSRPPKEEPLWLRHGEEHKLVNKKTALVDAFLRNISSGRFSDGKDAVVQAPPSKIYLQAKEKLNSWIASSDNKEDD